MTAEARLYCQTVARDAKTRKRVEAMHPGSTLQVIYEDFINRPNEILHDIYDMLGLPVPDAVQKWLDGELGDIKVHSSRIASQWTRSLSPQDLKAIYAVCSEFYKEVDFKWT